MTGRRAGQSTRRRVRPESEGGCPWDAECVAGVLDRQPTKDSEFCQSGRRRIDRLEAGQDFIQVKPPIGIEFGRTEPIRVEIGPGGQPPRLSACFARA